MTRPGGIIKTTLVIFLILFAAFGIITHLSKPKIKEYNPSFNARLLDGKTVSLEAYRGKPLLIYFWSTWCPTCKYQSPAVEALSKEYQVLTVCVYSGVDKQVKEFMQQNDLTFPVINDYYNEVRRIFHVKAVPTTFILDADGKIVFSEIGMMTGWGIRARMRLAH